MTRIEQRQKNLRTAIDRAEATAKDKVAYAEELRELADQPFAFPTVAYRQHYNYQPYDALLCSVCFDWDYSCSNTEHTTDFDSKSSYVCTDCIKSCTIKRGERYGEEVAELFDKETLPKETI